MIPSYCYGRSLEEWLLYRKLPIVLCDCLYILNLNEVKVIPVPFILQVPPVRSKVRPHVFHNVSWRSSWR